MQKLHSTDFHKLGGKGKVGLRFTECHSSYHCNDNIETLTSNVSAPDSDLQMSYPSVRV